jgi:hypothetical protein
MPHLKAFIKVIETNLETFEQGIKKETERKALQEATQREATSVRRRSLDAIAESEKFDHQAQELARQAQDLTRQAQEARARSKADANHAKNLEREYELLARAQAEKGLRW